LLPLTRAKSALSCQQVCPRNECWFSAPFSIKLILPITSFLHQLGNIPVQTLDDVLGGFDGCLSVLAAFPLPASDTVFLFGFAAIFDIKLVADPALCVYMDVLHHELHTTGLASAVLLSAVLTERPPLEVAALEDLLVKEAHVVVKL
jgi:hypothetical protein